MSIDPEILLGLHNSRQNQSSIELQRQILDMQKLQVLNQVRISQKLPPLAELPEPPPGKEENNSQGFSDFPSLTYLVLICIGVPVIFLIILLIFSGR
jgi:hypothetical protein